MKKSSREILSSDISMNVNDSEIVPKLLMLMMLPLVILDALGVNKKYIKQVITSGFGSLKENYFILMLRNFNILILSCNQTLRQIEINECIVCV